MLSLQTLDPAFNTANHKKGFEINGKLSMDGATVQSLLGSQFSCHLDGAQTSDHTHGRQQAHSEQTAGQLRLPALPVRGSLLHAYTEGKIVSGPGAHLGCTPSPRVR